MFNMEIMGKKIAELRKGNNMTQLELAEKMGVSFQAISNWERGNAMPDISKLPELSRLLCVTIDELFEEEQTEIKNDLEGGVKAGGEGSERHDEFEMMAKQNEYMEQAMERGLELGKELALKVIELKSEGKSAEWIAFEFDLPLDYVQRLIGLRE